MMKVSHRFAVFLIVQIVTIGLAVFLGWHLGPHTDQTRIADLEDRAVKLEDDLSRCECVAVCDLQAVLLSLQELNNTTDAVRFLNHFIDKRIVEQTAWVNTVGPELPNNPVLMPKSELWFSTIADIADYRESYPAHYKYPEIEKTMKHIFNQAKEMERQTSIQTMEGTE